MTKGLLDLDLLLSWLDLDIIFSLIFHGRLDSVRLQVVISDWNGVLLCKQFNIQLQLT